MNTRQEQCPGEWWMLERQTPRRTRWRSTYASDTSNSYVTPGCYARDEMEAAVWTALAILAAMSFGTLFYLGARIDGLGARLDARIDSLAERMDTGFARVDSRFDQIDQRFDALAARLDAHLDRHAG